MKAKIIETYGKRSVAELFGVVSEETCIVIDKQNLDHSYSRERVVEIEKGEYLACTEQVEDVPYLYQVSIFYADAVSHRDFYYLYKFDSIR